MDSRVKTILKEIKTIEYLAATTTDAEVKEELQQEQAELVAAVNNRIGTGHVARGSKMETINN